MNWKSEKVRFFNYILFKCIKIYIKKKGGDIMDDFNTIGYDAPNK